MRTILSKLAAIVLFLLSSLPITANTDPFSFGALTGATPNTLITSNIATITGFDSTASIRIEGGSYTIGNSVPTAAEGAITAGATVAVKVLSSSEFNTQTVATLTVGSGASATRAIFSVTTKPESVRVPNTINLTLSDTNADNPITITVNASDASGAIDIAELVATVVLAGAAVSTNGNEITYTPSAAGSETISIISINGIDVSGVSGSSAAFNVFHGALARIGLEPQNPTFLVNGEDRSSAFINVTLYDANNNLVSIERLVEVRGANFSTNNTVTSNGTGTVSISSDSQTTGIFTVTVGSISATGTGTAVKIANIGFMGISDTNSDSPITITISATDSAGSAIDISELAATVVLAGAAISTNGNQITYTPGTTGSETIRIISINGLNIINVSGDRATFNVSHGALNRIELALQSLTITVNDSITLDTSLLDANNNLFLPPTTLTFSVEGSFTISTSTTISVAGRASITVGATAAGVGTLTISVGAKSAAIAITATAAGPLIIVGSDITAIYGDTISIASQGGNPLQPVTWDSSIPTVATIDENSGLVTTTGVGTTVITASRDSSQASITLLVNPRQLSFDIDPTTTFVFNNTSQTVAVSLNNAVESDINSGAITLSISGVNTALNAAAYTFTTSVSGSASPNYIFSPITTTWTINQAEQSSFAFTLPSFIISTSTLDLSAFVTGASSTADVIYTISSGSGSASISNNILSPIGVGSISISAISPEDTNYLGATAVAGIHIIDALPPAFMLAATSITLTKNAPNTIRHIIDVTGLVADISGIDQQATFSITVSGDDIFTLEPEPVISFATNSIQTSALLTSTPTNATLYFSITPDTIGNAILVIDLDKANGQNNSQTLVVTVQDSDTAPVISNPGSRRDLLADFSVFGGHLYLARQSGTYQELLDDFNAEGGYLTRADNGAELLHVINLFPGTVDLFYLGADDIASEGDWVYTNDGTQFGVDTNTGSDGFVPYPGFINIFAAGEPNNNDGGGRRENCLTPQRNDVICTANRGGVFEFPNGFPATTNLGTVNIPFGATSPITIANLLGFDLDDDDIVWSATDSGAGGNINIIGITSSIADISYQPAPSFGGNISLTISLNEVGRTGRASAVIMISVLNPIPSLVTPTAQVLSAGEPVALTIINNGGVPTIFGITPTLPTSLSIDLVGSNIVISGTPIIAQQSTTYTLSTSNAVGTDTISFVISINIDPLSIVGGDITANYGDDAISITSQGGNPAQPITWTSSIPTVATIDENSGVVTIIDIGTTTITASRGSSQASISLLVNPRQLGLSVGPTDTLVFNNTSQTIAVSLTNAVEDDINSGAIILTISGDQTAINAGNYQFSVSISGSASPNYIFAPTTISWVVAAARQSELNITSNATRLMVGQTTTATATNDQPQGTLTITSSEAGIATINGSTITATNVGITTITITKQVTNYNNISASYQLLVIQNTTTPIDAGDDRAATYIPSGILSPQIPTNAQDRVISYAVDPIDSDVVTIDSNSGAITIINVGTVSIIASAATTTNYAASTDSYLLTINQAIQGTFTIIAGDTLTFGATSAIVIVDPGSGDGTITYESSDIAIATITADGIITATGVGEAIITATKDGGRNYHDISDSYLLTITNTTPTVTNLIPNQIASLGNLFTFPIPANTFNDANGDTLTISVSALPPSLTFDGINSITGIPATVGISTITITADDGNGAMVSTSFNLEITNRFIITGDNPRSAVYGDASQNIIAQGGASLTGAITFVSSTPSIVNFGDANIGVLTISGAGTAIITATRDGTGEQASISFIVSPRTITPTFASSQTFIYNTNIRTVLATITSGIIGTDDVSLAISGATATDVGNYNIDLTLTGAASRNYRLSTTTLSWSIIRTNQSAFSLGADTTITFGDSFSRPATGVSATAASSYGSSNPDVATVAANGDITTTGVGSAIISATNTGDNNYNSAADSYTLNVAPLTLTIAIGSTTTIYTGAAITITTTITNLVSGHEQVSLTINGDQTATNTGDYSFDISAIEGSDSPNYILIPTTISWVVAPARQSELDITSNATRLMVGQTTTATATNNQPQGTLTIISSEAGIATIDSSTITATNVGITTITITKQVANHNNISASYQLVVVQNTTTPIDAGDDRVATYAPSGALSAQTPTNTRGRVISYAADPITSDVATININTGAITITNVGTVSIVVSAAATTNYATSTDSYLLTINQATQGTFTITASDTLTFGATSAVVVVDPGSGEGTITYAASPSGIITIDANGIISAVGAGEAIITATKAGGRNYNDISASISIAVTRFSLDIDGDGSRLTTTDGILIIRYLTSTNTFTTIGVTTTDATIDEQTIKNILKTAYQSNILDIDDNGTTEVSSDGMLIMRYLADQENLNIDDLVGSNPTRSLEEIREYLEDIY